MDAALNACSDAKYILGCAFLFLVPYYISKVLLEDSLNLIGAFGSLVHTVQDLKKRGSKTLLQRPNCSSILQSITEVHGNVLFQQQIINNLNEAKSYF